ncbi:MAG TPA: SDR family oxidoreductase [Shinella sp.]|jgi:NAD(P)-dependent dehydrogenase (short-subunit alcohol dehydrogenase family)|uniref:SDR family NAD(P)-dependent oxidoreductase n=1 Tax=Shinella sp. TaxID=1870904 RepID=UPI002E1278C0|nr:SDR family oxidoreductase [Shinella sp.]
MTDQTRTALIAGGAGGMGAAIAARLSAAGYAVAIADLAGERLTAAAEKLQAEGRDVLSVPLDMRKIASCAAAVEAVLGWRGRLDVVVNAAGVWREGEAGTMTEDDWDIVMDVNLKGAFFLIQAAIPHLGPGASIVNIASDAGLVGNNGASIYCASKGGLVLLTKALALELAPRQIRVNAVCPGDVATPMIEFQAERYGGGDPDGYKAKLLSNYPQGAAARFIRPEEIARMVAYLCEPDAAPITGAALSIDFGVTAGY